MSQTKAQLIDNLVSPITGALGSASAPTFSFTADPNTGIYSPGADQLAISTGGSGRLFVDASGRVGVGTSNQLYPLSIQSDASSQSVSIFGRAADDISEIAFFENDRTTRLGELQYRQDHVNFRHRVGYISVSAGGVSERLRITSAGLVGIGTSSPSANLTIQGISGTYPTTEIRHSTLEAEGEVIRIARTDAANIRYHSITAQQSATAGGANNYLAFKIHNVASTTAQTEVLRLTGNGRVGIGTTSPSNALTVVDAGGTTGSVDIGPASAQARIYAASDGIRFGSVSNNDVILRTNNTERARIDSSGRLLVGTSSAIAIGGESSPKLQLIDASATSAGWFNLARFTNSAGANAIQFGKSRGTAVGNYTIVQNNDALGSIIFAGSDGTDLGSYGAQIKAEVDGTPGANDMPGRLVFSTTADGASSPTERLRITSAGLVGIGTSLPEAKLEVVDTASSLTYPIAVSNFTDPATDVGSAIDFRLTTGGNTRGYIACRYTGNSSTDGTYLSFAPNDGATGNVERVRITKAGNVGIGDSAPDALLVIKGNSDANTTPSIRLKDGTDTREAWITNSAGDLSLNVGGDDNVPHGTLKLFDGGTLTYAQEAGERLRIDSSGRLLVGTSSSRSNWFNSTGLDPLVQLEKSSFICLSITRNDNTDNPGEFVLGNSRSSAYAALSNNDKLGRISFQGADGSKMVAGAYIQSFVDGTPGASDMPGRLVFSTTADGASAPTERMRLTQDGRFYLSGGWYTNITTANAANVHAVSNGEFYRSTSSIKYKTDIETLQDSYADAILNVRPVWYRSLGGNDNPDHSWWGFIAEEVAEIDPRLVQWKTVDVTYDENGSPVQTPCEPEPEGVAYDRFVPHLLNLIKRQGEAIADLQAEVAALKAS